MQVQIRDTGDLRAAARALGRHKDGKALKRKLGQELAGIQRPIVAKVKTAWRTAPAGRRMVRGQSLRGRLANATRAERRLTGREAGVRIRTDGRRMPPGMRALPTYAEGTKRPWRHPVYGEDVWVIQRPFPRFFRAVKPDESQARRRVERAVGSVFNEIARSR